MWALQPLNGIRFRGDYERQNIGERTGMARASVRGMERHLRDAAYVDADRGKSAAGAKPADKSLVGSSAIRLRERVDYFGDSLPRWNF